MEKWEYSTLVCYSHTSFEDAYIRYHNGYPITEPDRLVPLVEYLNKLGQEGWEMVGVLPNISINSWMILLKRKIDQ